jgi:mannosyl-oligosaccharide alpha-1,2-mannosidase
MSPANRPLRYAAVATLLLLWIYMSGLWAGDEVLERAKFDMGDRTYEIGMDRLVNSSFDWGTYPRRFPIESLTPLPPGRPRIQPRIQSRGRETGVAFDDKLLSHRREVRDAFLKAWMSYKELAWMRDELTPLSGAGKDTFGGWAATLIDNLDTLWIMDLKEEFSEAVEAVATLDWANTTATGCNIFETTIRHLGGLLAAYDLSGERVLLIKAIELGDMLYAGFDTPNHLPVSWLDFQKAKDGLLVGDTHQPSASAGSMSLEFTRLSQLTGDPKYYDAITRVTTLLNQSQEETRLPGIWPTFLDTRNGNFKDGNSFTLGALADSLYEYLPKMHAFLGNLDPVYEKLAKLALTGIKEHLLFRPMLPGRDNILYSGEAHIEEDGNVTLVPEVQHLGCFTGGMFGLSGRLFGSDEYVDLATRLTWGCIHAYLSFPTGIMPEIFNMFACPGLDPCDWDEAKWQEEGNMALRAGFRNVRDPSYLLRPEAIESIFILYRITGIRGYGDMAYVLFQAIQKATQTKYANAAIKNVTVGSHPTHLDSMEVSLLVPLKS